MINPFINDSKVQKMKESDKFKYMVIYPETFTAVSVDGFTDRDNAFSHAVKKYLIVGYGSIWLELKMIMFLHILQVIVVRNSKLNVKSIEFLLYLKSTELFSGFILCDDRFEISAIS